MKRYRRRARRAKQAPIIQTPIVSGTAWVKTRQGKEGILSFTAFNTGQITFGPPLSADWTYRIQPQFEPMKPGERLVFHSADWRVTQSLQMVSRLLSKQSQSLLREKDILYTPEEMLTHWAASVLDLLIKYAQFQPSGIEKLYNRCQKLLSLAMGTSVIPEKELAIEKVSRMLDKIN